MVRGAKVEDGSVIKEILQANGLPHGNFHFTPEAGFEPWWLVYETLDKVKGCVQVMPSKPIAIIDNLAVWPWLKGRGAGALLYREACRMLKRLGCQGVLGYIGERNYFHRKHAEKAGFEDLGKFHVYLRSL